MLRNAASRALWLAKGAAIFWGAVLTLALLFGGASVALGANGGNLLLGMSNRATALTKLTGDVNGPAMRVQNINAGSDDTALDLSVQVGEAPMKVNSTRKVTSLNSDLLDGKSANGLGRVALMQTGASTNIPEDSSSVTYGQPLSITAPAAGFVRVNGNVTVLNSGCTTGAADAECGFVASARHVDTGAQSIEAIQDASGRFGNASLDGVFAVEKGVNTFDIQLRRTYASTGGLEGWVGALTAEYTPYGSTGGGALDASGVKAAAHTSPKTQDVPGKH